MCGLSLLAIFTFWVHTLWHTTLVLYSRRKSSITAPGPLTTKLISKQARLNATKSVLVFLKKSFCYPALLTVDGWFHSFSSKGLGKSQFTSILLTDSRICLYNLSKYRHAPLLMCIYNNYSGYYKVRQRMYVNEPFDKLTLSGKNIKKNGPEKIWRLHMLAIMLRNVTWNWI